MSTFYEYDSPDLLAHYDIDEQPDAKSFGMHIHDRYEIYYFVAGEVNYLVEGREYLLEPDTIMIMRPGESHAAKILKEKTYKRCYINFHASLLDQIDPNHKMLRAFTDRELGYGNKYIEAEFEDIQIKKIFEAMYRCNGNEYDKRRNICIHLFLLLDRISQIFDKRGTEEYKPSGRLSEQIVAYVNRHLTEELSVPMLAKEFFLSTSQLSRIFKQATGSSVWEYIIKKRLTMARERMRGGSSAQEAATECGFKDYSVFYRAYVKHFGSRPTDSV